ncbi:MAG: T9SS type A sorting domain-containing protein [Rhodothermales bacterium]|nr:T9SS type A sorting domain-containing protein [Rhodothermales bacterium]
MPRTNSTQTTQAVTASVDLAAGTQIFRATVLRANPFTLDRFEFALTSTGSETLPSRPELQVHPNPVTNQLTLEGAEGQTVEVSDLLGRRIEVVPNAGARELIDLSRVASGLYVIRVSGNAGVSVRTVVRR